MSSSRIPSRFLLAVPGLMALACEPAPDKSSSQDTVEDTSTDWPIYQSEDNDGDGWTEEDGDCNDEDSTVYPSQDEECNGIDDNCNDHIDEDFEDTDNDGTADCLDSEDCDGLDNDGDGEIDEDFSDDDGDGIADCLDTEDCDGLDNDGDGEIDEGYDADGDGYTQCGSESTQEDCDDSNSEVSPGAEEVESNLIDDDCDGLVDEGEWAEGDLVINEVLTNPAWVSDSHGEWFELINNSGRTLYLNGLQIASDVDESHVLTSDELLTLEDGAVFLLGLDSNENTNGQVSLDYVYTDVILSNESDSVSILAGELQIDSLSWDDGETMPDASGASMALDPWWETLGSRSDPTLWCASYLEWGTLTDMGSPGEANTSCPTFDHDEDGYTGEDGDCDDLDPTVYPGAPDTFYDGIDQDCDLLSDYDADLDGYDSDAYGGNDCDDSTADISPSSDEYCDDIDNDCDGTVDEDDAVDADTWYYDGDGDGDGDPAVRTTACSQPSGYVALSSDCDDSDDTVYDCALGLSADNPGVDCADILDSDSTMTDDVYWIDPDGDSDPSDSFEVYCDMTSYGGGWTVIYWVDAEYFDASYSVNRNTSSTPPTTINTESDIWNAGDEMTINETLFSCTTQNDADSYYWYYSDGNPYDYYASTTDYSYVTDSSDDSNTTYGTCFSTHKAESAYGFMVIENGSCGSCNTMLYGMYHYTSGGGCNSTSTTYGSHSSPWDGRSIQYPICGGSQTSNGSFWISVR